MNAADECDLCLHKDSLIFRCCCSDKGRQGSPNLRCVDKDAFSPPHRGSSRAVIPPTLDGNSLVGSLYGLRARSAAVDQSCSPSN